MLLFWFIYFESVSITTLKFADVCALFLHSDHNNLQLGCSSFSHEVAENFETAQLPFTVALVTRQKSFQRSRC